MIKKINKIIEFILIFTTGSLFADLMWHLRMKTPILKRELILDLQRGGTPFLDWFIGLSFFVFIMWGIYIIFRVWCRKPKREVKK